MKSIKVDDDVHARLRSDADEGDISVSEVIRGYQGVGKKDSGTDRILDQIGMIHKRFDELFEKLFPSPFFSEGINGDDIDMRPGAVTVVKNPSPIYESPEDARQKEIERLRAMDEFQQNAISHPEDEVQ